ncbi:disks large-associated protein 1-like isoform X1 [Myxocyprinus asiaticus]|uniref:disks large-associated protein 1-like isoform X1 n=2 Tax=Myxocyprinus asiaticus TaxID=70543 RepID=UPI0022234C60|nr:disks large-associated protein 1-like isoform X1 [Myxocyprinus asiaticus]XP_051542723.1 disks large-associated protein 1-like isoform X1 [Myxocyprinus asiaticus]XP_051542724.1 disks large-associated protein 1-like isoform X1 [Myxocyprinus asiaticus]
MTMKGLSASRSHHHTLTHCDPSYDSLTLRHDRCPYVLNPAHSNDHAYYGCQSDLASSTFPRRHHNSHPEMKDECAVVPYVGLGGMAGGSGCGPCGIPPSLLEQFDHQQPVRKDGYHTLQYKRTAALEHQRSDSPGRIRHLVHSVQKLFTKSHSLEGPSQRSLNGNDPTIPADAMATATSHPNVSTMTIGTLHKTSSNKRGKSKERSRSESKPHARSPGSGYWSSDDTLDREICLYHQHQPSGVMTMGRHPDKSQSHYILGQNYNTLGGGRSSLKTSRSNNDVGSCTTCSNVTGGTLAIRGPTPIDQAGPLVKKSSWSSTLTVSRAREVYQKATVNIDKAIVKAQTCQQGRTCQFLQVPQDEWGGFSSMGQDDEIPCRRMRSGSYIKAMAEDDSGDSDCSPKPSPKVQARRASYLKATQPSLTEMTTLKISTESHSPKLQIRSHSYLRAVSEVSINRSFDSLDPAALLASPKFRSRNESYMRAMSTISQVSEVEVNGQIEAVCESVFSEMESQAVDALDLPGSGCFRMRSHSYVRAIEKGCSQDEEEEERATSQAILPPRTATTVRTIQSSTVSSCITTYKKTPPPVPPRSTPTRPYISITAQSSTESAQDAYNELTGSGPPNRALAAAQSGLSNSTESIDSMKALTAAIEAANAQVHGPASQHVTNSTITITTATATASVTHISQDAKRDALRKCLSIGIQVDGPEETGQSEVHCKFQSVGIQVEDERCHRRVTRSNSVTTAVQADLDLLEGLRDDQFAQTHQGPIIRQPSQDAATCTVSIQGSGNHYHACAQDDFCDVGFDPSILPPPDPWMDGAMEEEYGGRVTVSVCPQDGRWFLKLLQAEVERMEGWCQQMQQDEQKNELPEEILGKIRSAVGSAQLLMSQKFQQFRELCEENLNPNAHPRPVSQDLAGFWDMLQLSIENISLKFDELHQLKANNWRALDPPEKKERRVPPPVPRKPRKGPVLLVRDRSLEGSQRLEARKRLLAAKRAAASQRQSSVTECADSIEIYIPEAQTRL